MLSVNNLFVAFGDRILFDRISLFIGIHDKIGLVGKNGAGKSTLLKFIAGIDKPRDGTISKSGEVTTGYLAQDFELNISQSVRQASRSVFGDLQKLEDRKHELEVLLVDEKMLEDPDYGNWLDELSHLNEQLKRISGDKVEKKIELILSGLGFDLIEIDNPISTFSGGWQMRVELARLLLAEPNLILLDEPTNHLDIIAIEWLQDYLRDYPGAVMLISHDQRFLDGVTHRTIEISRGKLYDYKFSYSRYLAVRKEEIEQQKQKKKGHDKYIKDTKVLIDKFRAKKNKAAFAQGLIKKLERLEAVEVDDFESSSFRFSFLEPERSGKVVLKTQHLEKSFGDKKVFKSINFEVERGQKVALLGKNGTGKTTLIKIIANELPANSGLSEAGHNVSIGYYAQDQAVQFNPNLTVLETIEKEATGDMFKSARKVLGSFMFSGDDVTKKVKVLSGGERARLSLCKLTLKPDNFLLLDEPTNHLDIVSKKILKRALQKYSGTLLVVSHDRDFLTGLTDRVIEIRKDRVKEYYGGVNEFLDEKKKETIADFERKEKASSKKKQVGSTSQKEQYLQRKETEKRTRKYKNEVDRCEKELAVLEQEQSELEALMADPKFYESAEHQKINEKHQWVLNKVWKIENRWEVAMMKLEELEDTPK